MDLGSHSIDQFQIIDPRRSHVVGETKRSRGGGVETCHCQFMKTSARGVHERIGSATASFVMFNLRYQYSVHAPSLYSLLGGTIYWLLRYLSLHRGGDFFLPQRHDVLLACSLTRTADKCVSCCSLVPIYPGPLVVLIVFEPMERRPDM